MNFNLDKFCGEDDLGNLDMNAAVKGSGTSMKNLNARVKRFSQQISVP